MAADDNLHADQFSIEEQGETPLRYKHGGVQRLAATHPDVPPAGRAQRPHGKAKDVPGMDYWHPEVEVGRAASGKPLTKPKVVQNPSAAKPGTAAFLDYEDRGSDVYVHYMNTRSDMTGRGLGNRLMSHLADQFPDRTINLGRIESSHVYEMKKRLERQGRKVLGNDRGFFG